MKKSPSKKSSKKPLIAIIMGSDSDYPAMKDAEDVLKEFKIPYDIKIVSAHRTPEEMYDFAKTAVKSGLRVVIAGAGGAAHLPGMVASLTELPVIGVPVANSALDGEDSLVSIVQMPKGVPVATVAINNSYNAGLLAVQILAAGGKTKDDVILKKITQYKAQLRKKVLNKKLKK
jgi:phosphoribosylaminoimidazole carboxylase PurE protein